MTHYAPCRLCGEPEREHHTFTPYVVPDGCVCNPKDWRNPIRIPPVCGAYWEVQFHDNDQLCGTCEHEEACHKAAK